MSPLDRLEWCQTYGRSIRMWAGISARRAAEQLGVSHVALRAWETKAYRPNQRHLEEWHAWLVRTSAGRTK